MKIYLDFDGVVYDSITGIEEYIYKKYNEKIDVSKAYKYDYTGIDCEKEKIYKAFTDEEYFNLLHPFKDAIKAINILKEKYEVVPYTYVDKSILKIRNRQIKEVGLTGNAYTSKKPIIKDKCIIIEDDLKNLLRHIDNKDAKLYLIDAPYNKFENYEISSNQIFRIKRCKNLLEVATQLIQDF